MDSQRLKAAAELLARASGVMALTGAGVSAESGIPTFRGKDGLWNRYRPEELATLEALRTDPLRVWKWYQWRRQVVGQAQPNPAHHALARLEHLKTPGFLLVTQNVDGLHQRAGSRRVVEFHGNIFDEVCLTCGFRRHVKNAEEPQELPPRCPECGEILKPGVVVFGEPIPEPALQQVTEFLPRTEVLLVVGTSAQVYPAAAIPSWVQRLGGKVIEINPEVTPVSSFADISLQGSAGEILPLLVQTMEEIQKSHERALS